MSVTAADRRYCSQALALAALPEGCTGPNPRVGCLVVRREEVVGAGFHRAAGERHAEAMALAEAGPRARGATAYVSLEPCAHEGRTPPCADLLVRAGVRRVVASLQDPNPRVDGAGFRRLREAGVEVDVGCGAREAERVNEAFLHFHRTGRPLVTLKAAASLDGRISAAGGRSRWLSGPASRRLAHRLRMRHDAVLVGAGTVRTDDPSLTVRLPEVAASRRAVVLTASGDLGAARRLFDEGRRPLVYTTAAGAACLARDRGAAVEVRVAEDGAGGVSLDAMLADLAAGGVQSLLVEGGGRTHALFLRSGRADRLALFSVPCLLGDGGGTALVGGAAVDAPDAGYRLEPDVVLSLPPDTFTWGALVAPGEGDACSPG